MINRIMKYYTRDMGSKLRIALVILIALVSLFLSRSISDAGVYLNSAHGDGTNGVNRSGASGFPTDYPEGFCAHCHEQHASIGGSEPAPVGSAPSKFALFYYPGSPGQTDNFCYQCHTGSGSYQTGSNIVNRSYSYRAGGWTSDTLNDILEAFSYSSPGTSHNLDDISTFITGKWNYTADSNPCNACHNPHAAQGDPLGAGNSAKSSGTRGWPVSRPSQHNTDNNSWGLWGDASGEKMSDYTSSYQAPYRFGSTSAYEPDGSSTQNGSNLADFNTLCTDCHNSTNTIYSTTLTRNLKTIDWDNEKHGKGNADVSLCGDNPYPSGTSGLGKVLACTDCHEPHGSPNAFLIRQEVNGGLLGATIDSFGSANWQYLCNRCHQDDLEINSGCQDDHYYITHHSNTGCNSDTPYSASQCINCHVAGGSGPPDCNNTNPNKLICTNCHYHGSEVTNANYTPYTRPTF